MVIDGREEGTREGPVNRREGPRFDRRPGGQMTGRWGSLDRM